MRTQSVLRSAVSLAAAAVVASCSSDSSPFPTEPELFPAFNVVNATPGSVLLCPQGPAGTYSYEVAVTVPASYSYGGGGTFPPAVIAAAEANHELPMGATPSHTIPAANSNCVQVFRVNQSVGYPHPGNGVLIDPPRLVSITQTGGPPGAQLQYILATSSDQPSVDVRYEKPTVTVEVDPNFFHGWVASFWNLLHTGNGARTIGYWQNWSSCSGGGQAQVLDQTLGSFPVGAGQSVAGVYIGDLYISTCTAAVRILKKSDVVTGGNRANDAAYGLAAQLLAAELNVQNGATACSGATTAIANAQTLLGDINFTGTGSFLPPSASGGARSQALALASTLDDYNNSNLC
ncbi:MAG TPA: hypothetical protein VFZ56_00455 [Gemmatimonadaceae bacterium]